MSQLNCIEIMKQEGCSLSEINIMKKSLNVSHNVSHSSSSSSSSSDKYNRNSSSSGSQTSSKPCSNSNIYTQSPMYVPFNNGRMEHLCMSSYSVKKSI